MDVDGVEESPETADEELGASLLFLVAFSHGEQLVDQMMKEWNSPIYAFFKPVLKIKEVEE